MDRDSLFTERVADAHAVFLRAAAAAGAEVEIFEHPLPGPDGGPLAAATARLGPERPERMLAVVSGTHGIEGHAGSPVQAGYLAEFGARGLDSGAGLLMLHMVNPWGCAWNRRENEDNVDVFRNLVYRRPPWAANPLYEQYEEGINPRAWDGPERARADAVWRRFEAEHGAARVVATIRRGQHAFPKGITYHGAGPTWSSRVVEAAGARHLAGAAAVDVLDIHTGYGAHADAVFISSDAPGPRRERFEGWFAGRTLDLGHDPLLPAHPGGPYHVWEDAAGPGRVTHAGLEYGTYDVGERFELFRANTFIHTYGRPDDALGRKVSAEYRETFYPASPLWRARVLEQGLEAVRTMARGR